MTRFDVRLALRLHRFEVVGFAVLVGLFTAAALFVAGRLDNTRYADLCPPDGSGGRACELIAQEFWGIRQSQGAAVEGILLILPFLLGALVGVPLVARELERGTSRLAWSLAPSRLRWLVGRLVPAAAVVFAVSLVAGLALDRLLASAEPGMDVANSFAAYGFRGVVLAGRAVFVFAIGVAVGAILGRSLPALIVTAVIGYVGILGGSHVHDRIIASEAILRDGDAFRPGDRYIDQRFRLPDGRIATWWDIQQLHPLPGEGEEWSIPDYQVVSLLVPGERYGFAQLRELGALGGASLAFLGIAAATVVRRRPD